VTIAFGGLSSIFSGGLSITSLLSGAFTALSGIFTTIATFVTGTLIPAIVGLVSTFGLPIAIIGAVIGAGYLLIKNWNTVKEAAKALGEWISKTWDNIKNWTSEKWSAISQVVSDKVNELKTKAINKAQEVATGIANKWNEIKSSAVNIWNNTVTRVVNIVSNLVRSVSNKITEIKNTCSRIFGQIRSILTAPFESAKRTIDNIIGGISRGISKVTGFLSGKGKSISIDTQLNMPNEDVTRSFNNLEVQSMPKLRSSSITDSLKDLSSNINKLDYYSSRYRASNDNSITKSITSNNSNNDIKNELKEQNSLLTQLLNVMQSNNSDSGIHLNIENFNNNRGIDIKTLYEELEYYKYQSKLARGGV
jgi:phage-related protein